MSEHEVAKRSARNVGAGTSPLCRTASTWWHQRRSVPHFTFWGRAEL